MMNKEHWKHVKTLYHETRREFERQLYRDPTPPKVVRAARRVIDRYEQQRNRVHEKLRKRLEAAAKECYEKIIFGDEKVARAALQKFRALKL